jgi:hypothetical protein
LRPVMRSQSARTAPKQPVPMAFDDAPATQRNNYNLFKTLRIRRYTNIPNTSDDRWPRMLA